MNYTTLISAEQLQALVASRQPLLIFDCSCDLMQPQSGEKQYLASHIPGAVHADLETALSARHGINPAKSGAKAVITITGADAPASGGRHPLPNRERFSTWLSGVGFSNAMQAVVYDRNGANYCGRLWWMLKWVGHEKVAVLDGGLQAWQAAGGVVNRGEEPAHFQANFLAGPPKARLVDAGEVASQLGRPAQTLIDGRAAPRFKGEVEPLDPVAGHIPGALNRPFSQNFGPDGKFKDQLLLEAEFNALLGSRAAGTAVHYCGSGVSAIPNLLAMEIAGLGRTALYAGSWSDWCGDPGRPVAKS